MNHATLSQAYRTDQLEQPVFAANGPGRGRGLVYQYLIQTALSNGPSFNCGEIGVKREQAVFNPAGPGRGGVGVYHPSPTPPGRGGMVMNGMAGSHVENGGMALKNSSRFTSNSVNFVTEFRPHISDIVLFILASGTWLNKICEKEM